MAKFGLYRVTIEITVFDADLLKVAAAEIAAKGGMAAADWEAVRKDGGSGITADLQMILDPGESPEGTNIQESSVETLESPESPRYVVDGTEPGSGNWDGGEGVIPPFCVFDTEKQEHLPHTVTRDRASAEASARWLNDPT